ncbi:MAG: lantibiotic dehydratase [Deltaproteobacteria bacterium]|nr:lantibiotic dehydratase [Deltaproteobacteria bacterium]
MSAKKPATTEPARTHKLAERFVLRSPVLPLAALEHLDVRALLADPGVREALFIASPELTTALEAGSTDPGVLRAAVRYLSRMAFRATPFGLFSGVVTGTFAATSELRLAPRTEHDRHTRLDNDYLAKLCDAIAADPAMRGELTFGPTSSLYRVGDKYRYAAGKLIREVREYHLVAIDATPYLDAVIERARAGATLDQLAAVLASDPELTREEIDGYLGELVAVQLLVPTLQPRVTGPEPATVLRGMLDAMPSARGFASVLGDVSARLAAIDEAHGAAPETYRAIAAALEPLPAKVSIARLFQVDVTLRAPVVTLGPRVAAEITRAFELTRKLVPARNDEAWRKFREQFNTRYETREVPLVEVLDEESGIGFGTPSGDTAQAPLIRDLPFPAMAAGDRTFTAREATLLRLVGESRGATELVLSDADVAALAHDPGPLADTVTFTVRIAAASREALDRGDVTIDSNGFTSASATRLLGRFCHGSREVHAFVDELVAREHALAGDAILAEIVHLPEGRLGNILLRPVLREYEIPYMGTSGARADKQIPITDLLVSVHGSRVVLRSRRLGREVRPQLATAHNYGLRSLAIYRFLCAHASQHTEGGQWSWGALESLPFLPRVRHGKVLLARATWSVRKPDLEKLTDPASARALRDRRGLPRWIVVADGDNELPVDFDNDASLDAFVQIVRSREATQLVEMHPAPDQLIVDGADGKHTHEIVVAFVREQPAPQRPVDVRPVTVERRFPPGSRWLYAKLYAGTATLDALLREAIAPLVREAIATGIADRWFFLRYADPDDHVRLRFHGDPARLAELLPRLAELPVRRLVLDTYEREVERYGGDRGIELAEHIFAADSEAVLTIVEHTRGDEGADVRWKLAVLGLDLMARDLGLDVPARLALATRVRDGFAAEHGVDTAFQKRLGDKFRAHATELAALLATRLDDPDHDYAPGLEAFAARSAAIAPLAAEMRAHVSSVDDVLASLWHMHVNRMLPSMQRRQELVIYDLLRRHYDGVIARQRAKK